MSSFTKDREGPLKKQSGLNGSTVQTGFPRLPERTHVLLD